MFGLSLFRPSRQSNTSKIQISPPLGEHDHSNALPQGTIKSPPHAQPPPPPPPPPPRRHNIDMYIISGRSGHTHRTNFPGVRGSFTTVKVSRAIDTSIMIIGKEISQSVKCIQKTQTFRGYDEKPWQL